MSDDSKLTISIFGRIFFIYPLDPLPNKTKPIFLLTDFRMLLPEEYELSFIRKLGLLNSEILNKIFDIGM